MTWSDHDEPSNPDVSDDNVQWLKNHTRDRFYIDGYAFSRRELIYNLALSPELETAIEMKMVQEQEAEKAKFTQLKARIEADTAIIRAKGEAEAIQVRGTALKANPDFIKLQILQSWNGRSPLVVGGSTGNILMSLEELSRRAAPAKPAKPAAAHTP